MLLRILIMPKMNDNFSLSRRAILNSTFFLGALSFVFLLFSLIYSETYYDNFSFPYKYMLLDFSAFLPKLINIILINFIIIFVAIIAAVLIAFAFRILFAMNIFLRERFNRDPSVLFISAYLILSAFICCEIWSVSFPINSNLFYSYYQYRTILIAIFVAVISMIIIYKGEMLCGASKFFKSF